MPLPAHPCPSLLSATPTLSSVLSPHCLYIPRPILFIPAGHPPCPSHAWSSRISSNVRPWGHRRLPGLGRTHGRRLRSRGQQPSPSGPATGPHPVRTLRTRRPHHPAPATGWGDPFDSKTYNYITNFLKLDYRVKSPLSVNNHRFCL